MSGTRLNGNGDSNGRRRERGRPPIEFTAAIVDRIGNMAFAGCTVIEIAAMCRCSVDTIDRNFADLLDQKRAERKFSLRWAQTEMAIAGHPTMLIFLGKQELGQADAIPEIPWDDLDADDLRQIEQGVLPFKLKKRA